MKKNLIYLLSVIALFASCSTAYKTSQTPDDVYYSPGKKIYVTDAVDRYESYPSSPDDAYLRMKVKDHDKWNAIDDYDYWYDSRYYMNNYYSPYTSSVSIGLGFGSYYPYYSYNTHLYNSYGYSSYGYNPWGSWYNPCYTVVYYKSPAVYYKPVSKYTLSTYSNRSYNNYNMPLQTGIRSSAYNNNNYYNSSSNANKSKNSYYNPNQNNSNSSPSRSFNSGSSSMSSGGGSRISGGGSRTRP